MSWARVKSAQAADFAGLLAWRYYQFAAFPQKSSGLQTFFKRAHKVSGFRLTVARRRRLGTVFPSTKSAVNVVCGTAPQGWGGRENTANSYVPDNTVTRGRPLACISTLSCVWNTCSSNSR